MAFYVCQAEFDFKFKLGYCEDERLQQRVKEHETSGGPQVLCGHVPGAGRDFERKIFSRLDAWRLASDDRKPFEIFSPTPGLLRFLSSAEFRRMGYVRLVKPRDPKKQTVLGWLRLVQKIGKGRDIEQAASMALTANNALRKAVPITARGGWDLNELIGGDGYIDKQQSFGFDIREHVIRGWLVRMITYKGTPFTFPVFAEMYERQTGKAAPSTAIYTGVPFRPKTASGRKGRSSKGKERITTDPRQLALGGCA